MHGLERAAAAIRMTHAAAQLGADVKTRARDVIDELAGVVDYAGAVLATWDESVGHHHVVAVADYNDDVVEALTSAAYVSDPKWPQLRARREPLRWADVPGHASSSAFYQDMLRPHGYLEGVTVPIYSAEARYVGMLALSVSSTTAPTDDQVMLLQAAAPSLSGVLQLPALVGDDAHRHSLTIARDGTVTSINRSPPPPPGLVSTAIQFVRQDWIPGRFLAEDAAMGIMQVEIVPWDASIDRGVLVTWYRRQIPYGLSLRELDVLSGLIAGLTNREISVLYGISDRTVSTHVEHILRKLNAPSRAAAVARGVHEGLHFAVALR